MQEVRTIWMKGKELKFKASRKGFLSQERTVVNLFVFRQVLEDGYEWHFLWNYLKLDPEHGMVVRVLTWFTSRCFSSY